MVPKENEMSEVTEVTEADVPAETETVAEEPAETEETAVSEEEQDWDGDPTKLPPQLQKIYKGMQADYTRKSQELKGIVDSVNSHKERLALLDRAEAGDPEAMAALARFAKQDQKSAEQQKGFDFEQIPETFKTSKDMISYLDQRFGAALQNYMNQVLQQHIAPLYKTSEVVQTNEVKAQIDQMRSKYTDFDKHIDAIIEVKKQNPGISLEAAYKVASYQKPVDPRKTTAKPGVRPTAVKPATNKKMTWEEAVNLAKQSLGD